MLFVYNLHIIKTSNGTVDRPILFNSSGSNPYKHYFVYITSLKLSIWMSLIHRGYEF